MEWSESLKPVDVLSQTFVVFFAACIWLHYNADTMHRSETTILYRVSLLRGAVEDFMIILFSSLCFLVSYYVRHDRGIILLCSECSMNITNANKWVLDMFYIPVSQWFVPCRQYCLRNCHGFDLVRLKGLSYVCVHVIQDDTVPRCMITA